jgi:type II secretory pathway pseudopilin PulG
MRWRESMRDETGYSLIELLVAIIAGLVVSAAALAVLISSVDLGQSDGERVDANQEGSVAMEKIVQALNSSCVLGQGVSPIVGDTGGTGSSGLTGSTGIPLSSANSLTFYSSLTDTPTITPNEINIGLTGGALVMSTYPFVGSTSTTGPTGAYSLMPTSRFTLVSHAIATPGQPLFTYSGYDQSTGLPNATITPAVGTPPALGTTGAADTAAVQINFEAQPGDGNIPTKSSVDFQDSVVLRLTAVSSNPGPTGDTIPQPCS